MGESAAPRDAFGKALLEVARTDSRVVALAADLAESVRLDGFRETFPERFVQFGVAEQNLIGTAAGMALAGAVPFAASFAAFSPGRSWEQIRLACYSGANIKVIGSHAGLSVGPDGATHQALEDLAITRVIPGLTVLAPADEHEVAAAVRFAAAHQGPVYIRFGRAAVRAVTAPAELAIGKAKVLREGVDVAVWACGAMLPVALKAAEALEIQGIRAAVVSSPFVAPLDVALLKEQLASIGAIVTVEDHQIDGGLGGAVAEVLAESGRGILRRVGVKRAFGQSGTPDELYAAYGLTAAAVAEAATQAFLALGRSRNVY